MRSLIVRVPPVMSEGGQMRLRDPSSQGGAELAKLAVLTPRMSHDLGNDASTGFLFQAEATTWTGPRAAIDELLNAARKNVLVLSEPLPEGHDSIEIGRAGKAGVSYTLVDAPSVEPRGVTPPGPVPLGLARRLLRKQARAGSPLRITMRDGSQGASWCAVYNPLLFWIDPEQQHLKPPGILHSLLALPKSLTDLRKAETGSPNDGLLLVAPQLDDEAKAGLALWESIVREAVARPNAESLILQLLRGPNAEDFRGAHAKGCTAAFHLDRLGGARFHASWQAGRLAWQWVFCARPPANLKWLGKYWALHWGFSTSDHRSEPSAFSLPLHRPERSIRDRIPDAGGALPSLARSTSPFQSVYQALQGAAEGAKLVERVLASSPHLRKDEAAGSWEVDDEALLDEIGRSLCMPRTPVLIDLPDGTKGKGELSKALALQLQASLQGRCLGLDQSVEFAGAQWLRGLLLDPPQPVPESGWRFEVANGWWRFWHRDLYQPLSCEPIRLVPQSGGFLLGQAVLKTTTLGPGGDIYTSPQMFF